jgi:hypothetical protein
VVVTTLSPLALAAPFLIADLIVLVSILTTNSVVKRAEKQMSAGWDKGELSTVESHKSPETHALTIPWAVDAAQIPSMFGVPLGGLAVLNEAYGQVFLIAYTAVLAVGLIIFMHFLDQLEINDYEDYCAKIYGYKVSWLTISALVLNTICAPIAAFAIG